MKQIEIEMNNAIYNRRNFSKANTQVIQYPSNNAAIVLLHGNCIAVIDNKTGARAYSCRGWHTMTTRSRLNALGADVRIKNSIMIFNKSGETVPDTHPVNLLPD